MANVLSELFGNIANAIRDKTGETGTMKPNDFPSKILGIVASSATFTSKTARFTANGGAITVVHDMGTVPDILIVYLNHVPENGSLTVSIGLSQAMMNALGEGAYAPTSYIAKEVGAVTIENSVGMESSSDLAEQYGCVRNVTNTTFVVGGGTKAGNMIVEKMYSYFAISGIV